MFYCCVPNCGSPQTVLRSLPIHNIEMYNIWVKRIANPKLTVCKDLKKAYKTVKVCSKHFSEYCISPGEKMLKWDSLPTLHLPGFLGGSSERNSLYRYYKMVKDKPSSHAPAAMKVKETATKHQPNLAFDVNVVTEIGSSGPIISSSSLNIPTTSGPSISRAVPITEGSSHPKATVSDHRTPLGDHKPRSHAMVQQQGRKVQSNSFELGPKKAELSEEILNSSELCRTCLSVKAASNIFEANCGGISVLQMLRECLNHEENHPPQVNLEVTAEKLRNTQMSLIQCYEKNNDDVIENLDGPVETPNEEVVDLLDIKTEIVNLTNDDKKEAVVTEEQENMICCQVCGISIASSSLQEHLRKHLIITSRQKGFTCIKCKLDFTNGDELRQHCTTESHLMINKKCLICNITFENLLPHYNHIQAMHNDIKNKNTTIDKTKNEEYSCFICDTTIKHDSLRRHLKTHLISKSRQNGYTCMKCKLSFRSVPALREHCESDIHFNRTCLICDKTFCNLWSHYKHMQLHQQMSNPNTPIRNPRKKRQRKYTCRFCKLDFETFSDIYSHYQANHYSSKDCIICKRTYNLAKRVRYHINSHSDKKFSCYPCRVAYVNREELEQHKLTAEHINRKQCSICFKIFKKRDALQEHMLGHTKEKKYQCDKCGQRFIYSNSAKRHQRRHAGACYMCDACGKVFSTKRCMDVHKHKIHGDSSVTITVSNDKKPPVTPFLRVCEICGHVAKSRKGSILHQACHKYKHTRICKKCNATFLDQAELDQHIESSHQVYRCMECPQKFVFSRLLKRHTLTHQWYNLDDVDDLNCCRFCMLQFDDQEQLIEHIAKEHEIHPCLECKKCFLYKYLLDDHNKTRHLGVYKYNCSFCDINFATKFQMDVHELTHTEEKPHVCEICSTEFRHKAHLRGHMRIHTGEPFICKFCNKAFSRLHNCVAHEKIHTGEKPYTCEVCDIGFDHESAMKKHIFTHIK